VIALVNVLRELAGLFVDDGAPAFAIIAIVAVAGILAILMPHVPLVAGAVLLFGCLGVLFLSAVSAGRR
jgi:hypothetical protein